MAGGSRRYRREVEEQIEDRVKESILRQEPVSLTAAEMGRKPVTRAPQPVHVWAWVRYPSQAIRVQALADAWTENAVRITYLEPFISSDRTIWVWANAVERAHRAGTVGSLLGPPAMG